MFYEFSQNNSGGNWVVTNTLCHRVIIEANSQKEANRIAEDLGCYWDGVDNDMDCSCCGDRWSCYPNEVDVPKEYPSDMFIEGPLSEKLSKETFIITYGSFTYIKEPKYEVKYEANYVSAMFIIKSIEEYYKLLSIKHGWTNPDARIFYKNGTVVEIPLLNERYI